MPLRDLLIRIAKTYDAKGGTSKGVTAQDLLREVKGRADLPLPSGFVASGHGGQTTAASTPWIGVFDPEINKEPQEGLYLAYIFDADLTAVTLTLQQGVTKLSDEYKPAELRRELVRRAKHLRAGIQPELAVQWTYAPSFGARQDRPRAYEAGSVAARCYEIANLPAEDVLAEDLRIASLLLRDAAASQRIWLQTTTLDDEPFVYTHEGHVPADDPLDGFHPNDSSDYFVRIKGGQHRRKRAHEELINDFGLHVVTRGYTPITRGMYPRDLVLRRRVADEPRTWLVEGKAVMKGNATN
ncbi:MrcB family domain-containing protein [Streptomyces sp. NPDC048710]|uniref:MrcB family domain-containing protein n=1 Tax=Streptomyces sp. NPDC048710 TaxID=3365586 RepID=UPI003714E9AD